MTSSCPDDKDPDLEISVSNGRKPRLKARFNLEWYEWVILSVTTISIVYLLEL